MISIGLSSCLVNLCVQAKGGRDPRCRVSDFSLGLFCRSCFGGEGSILIGTRGPRSQCRAAAATSWRHKLGNQPHFFGGIALAGSTHHGTGREPGKKMSGGGRNEPKINWLTCPYLFKTREDERFGQQPTPVVIPPVWRPGSVTLWDREE